MIVTHDPRSARRAARRLGAERGGGVSRAPAGARGGIPHAGRTAAEARVHAARPRRHAAFRRRSSRPVSLHPRTVPDDVPGSVLDDAADRRLRHRRGYERAVQIPDQPGPDGAVDRFRHADADGLRQRPPAVRRRGRPRGRGRRHAGRCRASVRRHRSRAHLGVDDDQSDCVDPARDVHRARAEARIRSESPVGHDPGRYPEGVSGAEGVDLSHCAVGAHRARLHHVVRAQHEALQPDQHLGLPHLGGRRVAARRRPPSRCATSSPTSKP